MVEELSSPGVAVQDGHCGEDLANPFSKIQFDSMFCWLGVCLDFLRVRELVFVQGRLYRLCWQQRDPERGGGVSGAALSDNTQRYEVTEAEKMTFISIWFFT
jgi:hypothetical protein